MRKSVLQLCKNKYDDKRRFERQMYENDQKSYFDKRNLSLTRQRDEDEEVSKALEEFERNMNIHTQNKQNRLRSTAQRAEDHINLVMQKLEDKKHHTAFDEGDVDFRIKLEKSLRRQIECNKERDRLLKYKKRSKNEKIQQELEKAKMNLRQKDKELADRNKYILRRVRDRDNLLRQKRKAFESEVLQRQEIHRLRRENQVYNYMREQAMKNDYKKQLIDKLKEKSQKADKIRERSKTANTHSLLNMTMM